MKTTLTKVNWRIKQILFMLILICFSLIPSNILMAQADVKDPSFGAMGMANCSFDDLVKNVKLLIQPDNKIIAAGTKGNYPNSDFILTRFMPNGAIDTTFGNEGIVVTGFNDFDFLIDCALLSDGSIITAGNTESDFSYDFALALYDSEGNLITSFDGDGKLILDFVLSEDNLGGLVINPDNTITITGVTGDLGETIFLYKMNLDGTPVTTFGIDGLVVYEDMYPIIKDAAIQDDGKIVVVGKSYDTWQLLAARFNIDGTLDNTFSDDGIYYYASGLDDNIGWSVSIQEDGKIVIVGNTDDFVSDYKLMIIRLLGDGTPDVSFGDEGVVLEATGIESHGFKEHILLPDHSIVCVGTNYDDYWDYQIVAINENGTLNTDFDVDGILNESFGTLYGEAFSIAQQADGKITVGGCVDSNFSILRYAECSAYFELTPDAEPHVWTALNYSFGAPDLTYLWDWNDGTFSEEAYPSHTYATEGFYTICLTITDANGCISTYCDSSVYLYKMNEAATMITVNVKSPVIDGIPNIIENGVSVVTNPFNDHLSLTWNNPTSEGLNLYLYDMQGRLVLSEKIYSTLNNIPVNNLSTGIYFLKISSKGFEQKISLVHQED